MTTPNPRTTAIPDPVELAERDLAAELAHVTRERDSADTKAGALLAGVVGALAAELGALAALGARLGLWPILGVLTSTAVLVAAATVLSSAIRPHIGRRISARCWGFMHAADQDPADLLAEYVCRARLPRQRAAVRAAALVDQSRRVRRKFGRVALGVDLARVGLGLAAVAAVLAVLIHH